MAKSAMEEWTSQRVGEPARERAWWEITTRWRVENSTGVHTMTRQREKEMSGGSDQSSTDGVNPRASSLVGMGGETSCKDEETFPTVE